jgi:hypothetical protein
MQSAFALQNRCRAGASPANPRFPFALGPASAALALQRRAIPISITDQPLPLSLQAYSLLSAR